MRKQRFLLVLVAVFLATFLSACASNSTATLFFRNGDTVESVEVEFSGETTLREIVLSSTYNLDAEIEESEFGAYLVSINGLDGSSGYIALYSSTASDEMEGGEDFRIEFEGKALYTSKGIDAVVLTNGGIYLFDLVVF